MKALRSDLSAPGVGGGFCYRGSNVSKRKLFPRGHKGAHRNVLHPAIRDCRQIDLWESAVTSGETQTVHKKCVSASLDGGDVREVMV